MNIAQARALNQKQKERSDIFSSGWYCLKDWEDLYLKRKTPFWRSLFERLVSFKCGLNIIHNKEEKDCTKKSIGGKEPLCVTREAFSNPIITSSNGPTRVTITNKTISKLKRYNTAKKSVHAVSVFTKKFIHFVQMNNETESGGYYFAQNIASYLCTIRKNKNILKKFQNKSEMEITLRNLWMVWNWFCAESAPKLCIHE